MTPIAPVQSLQMGLIASLLILSISACAPSKPPESASPSPEVSTPPPSIAPSPTASPKPSVKPSGKEGASQSTGPADTGTIDREPESAGETSNSEGGSSSAEVEAPVVPKVKAIEADVPAAKPIPRQADPAPRETEPEPRVAPAPRTEDPAPPVMAPKGSSSGAQEGPDPEPPAPNP